MSGKKSALSSDRWRDSWVTGAPLLAVVVSTTWLQFVGGWLVFFVHSENKITESRTAAQQQL